MFLSFVPAFFSIIPSRKTVKFVEGEGPSSRQSKQRARGSARGVSMEYPWKERKRNFGTKLRGRSQGSEQQAELFQLWADVRYTTGRVFHYGSAEWPGPWCFEQADKGTCKIADKQLDKVSA